MNAPISEQQTILTCRLPGHITAEIKKRALGLGFQKIGIVRAELLAEERLRLNRWLESGYHGEMTYMVRDSEQRSDPRRL